MTEQKRKRVKSSDNPGHDEICYYQPEWKREEEFAVRLILKVQPDWYLDEDQVVFIQIYNMMDQEHGGSQGATVLLTEPEIDQFILCLEEAKRRLGLYCENGGQRVSEEELRYPFSPND